MGLSTDTEAETTEEMIVQWFPGHMTKTRRHMEKLIHSVDAVAEIIDARIPISSRNPEIDTLISGKPRLLLMNKSDMADRSKTDLWVRYFSQKGLRVLEISCRDNSGIKLFVPGVRELLSQKLAKYAAGGMSGRGIRIMIAGVPNVGKSTLVNRLTGSSKIKAEDRPGVTRGEQWINLGDGVELLDTPGVLWPKFDDPKVGEMLAFTGAIKDTVVDIETLAVRLIEVLIDKYPDAIPQRYGIGVEYENFVFEVLERIALKRNFLKKGAEPDTERAAAVLMDEFRAGLLGRITLESPGER